jgi:hypothetical protein
MKHLHAQILIDRQSEFRAQDIFHIFTKITVGMGIQTFKFSSVGGCATNSTMRPPHPPGYIFTKIWVKNLFGKNI